MKLDLSPTDTDQLVDAWRRRLPAVATDDVDIARAEILQKIEALDRLADPALCARLAERQGLGRPASDYVERVVRWNNHFAVVGIRFRNQDASFPFVHVTPLASLLDAPDPRAIIQPALDAFADWHPRGFTFVDRVTSASLDDPRWQPWECVLFGDLVNAPKPQPVEGLRVIRSRTFAHYPALHAAYTEWMATHPRLAPFLRIEVEADLQQAAAEHGLFDVFLNDEWCGVWATREQDYYGRPGVYVFEKFLTARARGRRLAPAVDAAVSAALAKTHEHIWGHIHAANAPSFRSALRQGRRPVEATYFVPLAP